MANNQSPAGSAPPLRLDDLEKEYDDLDLDTGVQNKDTDPWDGSYPHNEAVADAEVGERQLVLQDAARHQDLLHLMEQRGQGVPS